MTKGDLFTLPMGEDGREQSERSSPSATIANYDFCDSNRVIPAFPRRRNLRLRGYDYSSEGLYFVTICTNRRGSLFGEIVEGKMNLSDAGKIVDGIWANMFRFSEDSQTWIVMPNHIHGIVAITEIAAGGSRTALTGKPLGRLIGAFKTVSSRRVNEIRRTLGGVIWQRYFYEHIIGNDRSFERILAYIQDNPMRWGDDPENPSVTKRTKAI